MNTIDPPPVDVQLNATPLQSGVALSPTASPDATQSLTASSESITVTVTLPAWMVASGQEFNITVTPKKQGKSDTRSSANRQRDASPPTPPDFPPSPVRMPALNLAALTPPSSLRSLRTSTSSGDDPFNNGSITNINNNGVARDNLNNAVPRDDPPAPRLAEVASDGSDVEAIYPLRATNATPGASPSNQSPQANDLPTRASARLYVITKGIKIGVFYDSWYVHFEYRALLLLKSNNILSGSVLSLSPPGLGVCSLGQIASLKQRKFGIMQRRRLF
jgi:hypothetical protein